MTQEEIIQSGHCPCCGGELILFDTIGHRIPSHDYDLPDYYEIDYYIFNCQDCGETIKTENEI